MKIRLKKLFYITVYAICGLPVMADEKTDSLSIAVRTEEVAVTDSIAEDVTTLDDFVIETKKKLIQSDGATLTYNVEEDPEASTNSTLEILRKVPGITVDAEENVKVNGQSSFKIYLNGREDPMMSGDIKAILKSMPASSIKKIEVISEPGAKYEAEGVGGILNIVTVSRQALEGYMANINLNLNKYGMGGSVYARTKLGKVTGSANVMYSNGRLFHHYTTSHQEYENFNSDSQRLRQSDSHNRNAWDYIGGNLNLSWEPDTLNLFTVSANLRSNTWGSTSESNIAMYDIDMNKVWSMVRNSVPDGKWLGSSAQVSYQHTFRKPGHNIIATYSFEYGDNKNNSEIYTSDIYGEPDYVFPYTNSISESHSDRHIFQIDYSNPFNNKHTLEAGAKGTFYTDYGNNAPEYGTNAEDAAIDEAQHVKLDQFRDIFALYASYMGNYGKKWNTRIGVRYEYTHTGIKYKIGNFQNFTTILNDLVPNASLTYKFNDNSNLRFAYQMRISRPGLGVLNPYRNLTSPGAVSYGDPNLKSEKNHGLSIAYSNYGGKLNGSFKVSYNYSGNSITDIIFSRDGLLNSTYANVGSINRVDFQLNLNWNVTNMLNLSMWLSENYAHMQAESELLKAKRVNWQTYLNLNADYTLPCKIRISAYGGFGTPWADLQSKGSSWYYYGVGLSRSFLKEDALTINLSAQNFLPAYDSSSWSQVSETARIASSYRYSQWGAGIAVSWRFGGLKSDVKKTNAFIENEEVSNGGSSNKN